MDMPINGIITSINVTANEPFGKWWITVVEHFLEWLVPVHHVRCSNIFPKFFGFLNRSHKRIRIHWIRSGCEMVYFKEIKIKNDKKNEKCEWVEWSWLDLILQRPLNDWFFDDDCIFNDFRSFCLFVFFLLVLSTTHWITINLKKGCTSPSWFYILKQSLVCLLTNCIHLIVSGKTDNFNS